MPPSSVSGPSPLRLLVGPYHYEGHWSYMQGAFDDYETITFGTSEGVDVGIRSTESIQDILERLPRGFQPDLLLLWRPEYGAVPWGLEELEVPVVMLTSDWYLEFENCLERARWSNLVVTGSRGKRVFEAAGIEHVIAMPMLGYEPGVDDLAPPARRDIDVFHAGNANWAVHAAREHVLAQLMDLPSWVNLKIRSELSRKQYGEHLARSRIVINPSVIGEVNMRVYETCASGACLFVEEENLDVPGMLEPGREVVLYNRENLKAKVLYYLEHERERATLAARGQQRLQARTYRAQMRDIVEHVVGLGLHGVGQRGRTMPALSDRERLRRYAATNLRYVFGDSNQLARRVAQGLRVDATPRDRELLAVMAYVAGIEWGPAPGETSPAEKHALLVGVLRQLGAVARDGGGAAAWFNFASLCRRHAGRDDALAAVEQAVAFFESVASIPVGEGVFYAFATDDPRRMRMQRAVWEAVERGEDPGVEARRHLLCALYRLQADLVAAGGDLDGAESLLRRAIATDPGSFQGRHVLAGLLEAAGRTEDAIDTLREHVGVRPLDLPAFGALARLQMAAAQVAEARSTLRHLHRMTQVFGDDAGRKAVELLLSRVEVMPASAAAAGPR